MDFIFFFRSDSTDTQSNLGSTSSIPRRDSLGNNIQSFLKTLAYWKRQPPVANHENIQNNNNNKTEKASKGIERSKSFSIKCDKGYAAYYQIEPKKSETDKNSSHQIESNNFMIYDRPKYAANHGKTSSLSHNPYSNFHEIGLPLPPPMPITNVKRLVNLIF